MLFNSYAFLILFLPITALGYAMLGRRLPQLAIGWLVLCSLFFYGYWNPVYLALLLSSIVVNFGIGTALTRFSGEGRSKNGLLGLGLAFNVGLIGYYKYAGFFVASLNSASGLSLPVPEIVLPLAISFFTFQQIAWLVDCWKGLTSEHSFLRYCLFVTFFPQLIAGPIVHHGEMLSQFDDPKRLRFRAENVSIGITIFILGLFKKVILADNIAVYGNQVFDNAAVGQTPVMLDAWIGALAYAFQLYFDFSGYSDMAIGLGRVFGIRLPVNFNSPYKAASIVDFWRRWHMTLSRFLRDYLYIPLGGSRLGPRRRYINLLLTMLLGGLWHGAGVTFVIWGGLHGLYLCVNHAFSGLCRSLDWHPGETRGGRVVFIAMTFLAVLASWVLFRSQDIPSALLMLGAMIGVSPDAATPLQQDVHGPLLALAALALLVWACPNSQQLAEQFEDEAEPVRIRLPVVFGHSRQFEFRPSYATGFLLSVLFFAAVSSLTRVQEFLYFQF